MCRVPGFPRSGWGTWELVGADCTRALPEAVELGYRHIGTAQAYGNETEVGQALSSTFTAYSPLAGARLGALSRDRIASR